MSRVHTWERTPQKICFDIHHRAYALKHIQNVLSAHNILSYLRSGPIVPTVVNDSFGKMPKTLDPSSWNPHYIRLHGRWEILDLDHRNYMSEHSEIPLHSPQNYLSLSGWRSSCCGWSTGCYWSCLWSRTSLSPREVHSAHWSHICT
jgi:hypothetical protein